MKDIKPETYSAAETAARLGFGKSTLTDHVRAGKAEFLRPIRLGTAVRFPRQVVDRIAAGEA